MAEPDVAPEATAPTTRRALRGSRTTADARTGRPARDTARAAVRRVPSEPTGADRPRPAAARRSPARTIASVVVMTFAAGLVATIALPSYAFDPKAQADVQVAHRSAHADDVQALAVSDRVTLAAPERDVFSATSDAQLQAVRDVKLRRSFAKRFASYTGPTASDYIKNPAHPAFSLSAVYQTALKYQGVPYVFGGADPSGMDCSGFIMFVYAQYGVSLPHSVHLQDGIGTPISQADAQPGDVIIFNDDSHDGFYAGNGMILHAPYPGASIRLQPLWSSDVHFERFGI